MNIIAPPPRTAFPFDAFTDIGKSATKYSLVSGFKTFVIDEDGKPYRFTPSFTTNATALKFSGISILHGGLVTVTIDPDEDAPSAIKSVKNVPTLLQPDGSQVYIFRALTLGTFNGTVAGVGKVACQLDSWAANGMIPLPPTPIAGSWTVPPRHYVPNIPIVTLLAIKKEAR